MQVRFAFGLFAAEAKINRHRLKLASALKFCLKLIDDDLGRRVSLRIGVCSVWGAYQMPQQHRANVRGASNSVDRTQWQDQILCEDRQLKTADIHCIASARYLYDQQCTGLASNTLEKRSILTRGDLRWNIESDKKSYWRRIQQSVATTTVGFHERRQY